VASGFLVYVVWTGEGVAPVFTPAKYLLLVPHYLPTGYALAGETVTEGIEIPFGWMPTAAVDPLNSQAIQAFWNAGPSPVAGIEYSIDFYPFISSQKPVVYWQPLGPPGSFILTGPGAALGPAHS
jgi:hypothetical protein